MLLCRRRHTIAELAAHLQVTDNAVRAQLQKLQRDGLAQAAGSRKGVRRPHVDYELTRKGRALFPKAYEPVLRELVDVLAEQLPQRVVRELLLRTGHRLMEEHLGRLRGRGPRQRIEEVMDRLNGSGGRIQLEEESGKAVLRACSCPIASVTAAHPEICRLLASVLTDLLEAPVRERCDRDDSPQCCFEVTVQPAAARA